MRLNNYLSDLMACFCPLKKILIYLDELGTVAENSLGVGIINLVVESEENSISQAKQLIATAQNQYTSPLCYLLLIDCWVTTLDAEISRLKGIRNIDSIFFRLRVFAKSCCKLWIFF